MPETAAGAVLRFGPEDLLRCRFAFSPVQETMNAVRALLARGRFRPPAGWREAVTLDGLEELVAVTSSRYTPDFLAPPPSAPVTDVAAELARVRATPVEQVQAELRRVKRSRTVDALLADPAGARERLATQVERAWQVLIEPWWPRIRDVLETDIAFQGRRLADGGIAALFDGLRPAVRWDGKALRIPLRGASIDCALDGRGLLLMPAVFHASIGLMTDPPWQPTLSYAARGTAAIWGPSPGESAALVALLGRTRSAVLAGLGEPASTGGLASRCGVPLSSVSEHLSVLRDAGLVSTRRTGRTLTHARTKLGDALLGEDG